jgi:hypothetical protein
MTSLLRELTPEPIPLSHSTTITSPGQGERLRDRKTDGPAPTTRQSIDSIRSQKGNYYIGTDLYAGIASLPLSGARFSAPFANRCHPEDSSPAPSRLSPLRWRRQEPSLFESLREQA